MLTFIPLWYLGRSGNVVGQDVQPRYILPLIFPLIGFAVMSTNRTMGLRLSNAQKIGLFLLVVVAQSIGLHQMIRRYESGLDIGAWNLNTQVEWWALPLAPLTIWIIGSVAFGVLAWLALSTFPPARRAS